MMLDHLDMQIDLGLSYSHLPSGGIRFLPFRVYNPMRVSIFLTHNMLGHLESFLILDN